MTLGTVVGLFADIHGTTETLREALAECRAEGVTTIALLGDLLDRTEQADPCAAILADWEVVGVYGNHEREIALAAARGAIDLRAETIRLLSGLQEEVAIGDILLTHDAEQWGHHQSPLARLLHHAEAHGQEAQARITFAGHTHFRQARDERGTIDIARGRLVLDPRRRYLINPGALAAGQFAIWDRTTQVIQFRQIEW
jgi:predicted phosphodiesterase